MPAASNAIIVAVDRLQAGLLGPYGNTWVHTPRIDALAAEGFLFDEATCDSPRLDLAYRAWWRGEHAASPAIASTRSWTLPVALAKAGVATTLVSDEQAVVDWAAEAGFGQCCTVKTPSPPEPADQIDQTGLARMFAEALAELDAQREPFLLWVHLGSLGAAWDAPLEFRNAFRGEDDPPPPVGVDVPEIRLDDDADPDELLGWLHAYAGQVSLLDLCLGMFLDALQDGELLERTLLGLASPRGLPLGEHRRVGPHDEPLYNETVHVPCILRLPAGRGAGDRSGALVQPADLAATLADWWELELPPAVQGISLLPIIEGRIESVRDRVVSLSGPQRSIRTPAWFLRVAPGGSDADGPQHVELFAKPDDRWEVNEVADRCPQIVEGLLAALDDTLQAIRAGEAATLAPLERTLTEGQD